MKTKQKMKNFVFGALLVLGVSVFANLAATPSYALDECDPSTSSCCGGVQTSILTCEQTGNGKEIQESGTWGVLLVAINILTAGVGVVAVGGIVYASILYTSAGGSAEQIKKSMTIIADIVIGVLAFALMYALLNFLIPGGLFT